SHAVALAHGKNTMFRCAWGWRYMDNLSGHTTLMDMYPILGPELNVPEDVFSVRGLLKRAK
ncbi:MAG: hypothetical protein DRP55_05035, partial [Spirochaetes bacterium]